MCLLHFRERVTTLIRLIGLQKGLKPAPSCFLAKDGILNQVLQFVWAEYLSDPVNTFGAEQGISASRSSVIVSPRSAEGGKVEKHTETIETILLSGV